MHANMLVFSLRQKDERDSLRSNSEEDGCRSSFSLTYVLTSGAFVMGCQQQFGASDIRQGVRRTASPSCGGVLVAQG
jgi:hypothetical protein